MDYFNLLQPAFWGTVGGATLCGATIGCECECECEFRGKPAGVRTSILICLSTAIFIHLGVAYVGEYGDPTRVLGQLVTGVGFLAAGVMLSNNGIVTGATTAAVIWVLAGIGAAVGFGHSRGALALSILTIVILVGVEWLESSVRRLARGVHESDHGLC